MSDESFEVAWCWPADVETRPRVASIRLHITDALDSEPPVLR